LLGGALFDAGARVVVGGVGEALGAVADAVPDSLAGGLVDVAAFGEVEESNQLAQGALAGDIDEAEEAADGPGPGVLADDFGVSLGGGAGVSALALAFGVVEGVVATAGEAVEKKHEEGEKEEEPEAAAFV
jgi:hypothetical protein